MIVMVTAQIQWRMIMAVAQASLDGRRIGLLSPISMWARMSEQMLEANADGNRDRSILNPKL